MDRSYSTTPTPIPQTPGFVNGTYTSSASATILTFLQMVNPDIPHNEGMVEPIQIIIPEGTILNASLPRGHHFWKPPVSPRMRMPSSAPWRR